MKPPRFPYFDFSDYPLDPAALRAHFAESLDAVTLCKFSGAGLGIFYNCHKYEQPGRTKYYALEVCNGQQGWWQGRSIDEARSNVYAAEWVGDNMLFGLLHAHTVRLDAYIFGPQPLGTIVQLTAVDYVVKAGHAQSLSGRTLHIDGSPSQLERASVYRRQADDGWPSVESDNPFQATYDYMDDSGLQTRYVRGFQPTPKDELFGSLHSTAASFYGKYPERRFKNPAYLEALAIAEPRFWTAPPNSLVLRASLTPHIGQVATVDTRRAHAHLVVARP